MSMTSFDISSLFLALDSLFLILLYSFNSKSLSVDCHFSHADKQIKSSTISIIPNFSNVANPSLIVFISILNSSANISSVYGISFVKNTNPSSFEFPARHIRKIHINAIVSPSGSVLICLIFLLSGNPVDNFIHFTSAIHLTSLFASLCLSQLSSSSSPFLTINPPQYGQNV